MAGCHALETNNPSEREFFIDNLLVRIHFIIEMIWWTSLAPWDFEFPFPGSLISTFLGAQHVVQSMHLWFVHFLVQNVFRGQAIEN